MYSRDTYAQVLKRLAKVVDGTPEVHAYEVANSTFRKIAAHVISDVDMTEPTPHLRIRAVRAHDPRGSQTRSRPPRCGVPRSHERRSPYANSPRTYWAREPQGPRWGRSASDRLRIGCGPPGMERGVHVAQCRRH